MNETQKLHLVSDELFSTKLTQLIEVLSTASPSHILNLSLVKDPENESQYIIVQNGQNVTDIIRDIVLLEIPEIEDVTELKQKVQELTAEVERLQTELANKVDADSLSQEVNKAVAETQIWNDFK